MNKILIGIDPDVTESGMALIFDNTLTIHKMKFFELYDFLFYQQEKGNEAKVYLEAGWLNTKSNWHVSGHGERVSARIGTKVGANHQVGKLIAEMCEYLGLEYELVQPRSSKILVKLFRKMTGYTGKVDQDGIDACLLIWGR